MIAVSINGTQHTVQSGTTLQELLATWLVASAEPFVVAVNQEHVVRAAYKQRIMVSDDRVEILTVRQGG